MADDVLWKLRYERTDRMEDDEEGNLLPGAGGVEVTMERCCCC
jgi:hypothetical protein